MKLKNKFFTHTFFSKISIPSQKHKQANDEGIGRGREAPTQSIIRKQSRIIKIFIKYRSFSLSLSLLFLKKYFSFLLFLYVSSSNSSKPSKMPFINFLDLCSSFQSSTSYLWHWKAPFCVRRRRKWENLPACVKGRLFGWKSKQESKQRQVWGNKRAKLTNNFSSHEEKRGRGGVGWVGKRREDVKKGKRAYQNPPTFHLSLFHSLSFSLPR